MTRGALTRSQADSLKLEKDKAAALQMQVSLRDAENAASEKAVRLAEGQLSFYKEMGELGGKYENHLDLQVQLIEEQAKKYEDLKIPPKLIEDWKKLKLLQVSTDPFDGAYRGLLKFNAEFADSGAQWEDITYGFASDFNSATKDMFDDFLDTGRVSFDDMGQLPPPRNRLSVAAHGMTPAAITPLPWAPKAWARRYPIRWSRCCIRRSQA